MPLTTLTIFTLNPGNRRWGLAQMGTSPALLRQVPGLRFFRLLGSGADNGFGLWPNLQRYSLLAVWENEQAAAHFFSHSTLWSAYQHRSQEMWCLHLAPIKSQGLWNGTNPFDYPTPESAMPADAPVAVLTRAAIRWHKAMRFWQFVDPTNARLATASGLLAAIGIGELPVVRQATFSVWESAQAMQQFAYRDEQHREVIKLTRQEKWYAEELFARFSVLGSAGTLDGVNPLAGRVPELGANTY
ncbi:hypothetical protein GCM10023185_23820 [Hymenobacter saemangeumensis]|uniref:Spheroidene monooxygenase n=1 Tax=Hymenobacter saemangeumensis TaxID=1084522 RepID=A0ABP8IGQ4_9BACT